MEVKSSIESKKEKLSMANRGIDPAKPDRHEVEFSVEAPTAKEVFLVGDFNDWKPAGNPMNKDKHGIWRTCVSLAPGGYQYRLIVDGMWQDDPRALERVPNPFGSENCVSHVVDEAPLITLQRNVLTV